MNTEETIRKIAAILNENRELKETIYGLNTDRNWWRTSALGTEKERSHLAVELIECHNMIDEQNARIEGVEGNIADREQHFNALDSVLDRTRELLHAAMDRIQTQNDEIDVSNKAAEIADGDAEYWWCIHNEGDAAIQRLLDGNNTFNGVLDDCRADVRKRDKIIDELKSKLTDQMQRNSEITKQRDNEADNRRRVANHLQHFIGERDAAIEELKAKLANSERQFNELDSVLIRTLALLHVVNGCLRKRDKTIDELESKLRR